MAVGSVYRLSPECPTLQARCDKMSPSDTQSRRSARRNTGNREAAVTTCQDGRQGEARSGVLKWLILNDLGASDPTSFTPVPPGVHLARCIPPEVMMGESRSATVPESVASAWRRDFATYFRLRLPDVDDFLPPRERPGVVRPGALPPTEAHPGLPSRAAAHLALPLLGACALAGFMVTHAQAWHEWPLLLLATAALVLGHLALRNHARRVAAERDAQRTAEQLTWRAQVADCESRRLRLAAFSQLAAQIAHEVRNPLSSIVLNTELLEDELTPAGAIDVAEARTLVTAIRHEAERLHALTHEYVTFARLPAANFSTSDLNAILRDVAQFVREEADRGGVHIALDLDPALVPAVLDPQQVRQVVLNLVKNSLDAQPGGGQIVLRTQSEASDVVLEVRDSGPGIPTPQRGLIFEPFFSTKASGTGLGLAVVSRVVREHGGRISVANDGGAVFTLHLPRSGPPPAETSGFCVEFGDPIGVDAANGAPSTRGGLG